MHKRLCPTKENNTSAGENSRSRRLGSVSFAQDDYSIADKYWNIYKGERKRSLTRSKSVYYDYVDPADGNTPLMKAIRMNYIKKTFNLLLFGADPNMRQEGTGDTALHMAVDNGDLSQVKVLLLFNADPTIVNKYCQSPIDIAENIKNVNRTPDIKKALLFSSFAFISFDQVPPTREIKKEATEKGEIDSIIDTLKEAVRLREKYNRYFEEHPTVPPSQNSTDICLLSLDGGGTRLFNQVQAMVCIEQRMMDLCPETAQKFYTYFDYIGGTSSGGMAACIFSYKDVDAFNGRAICLKGMLDVMSAPSNERGSQMDVMMQEMFSEEMSLADLPPTQPRVIVTASLAEYTPYDLHLMTNYGESRDGQAGPRERKVWEACRITTSAPSFFPVLRDLKLLDGGLVCNNPTLDCMAEVIEQGEREGNPVKIGCVISIGNGMAPKKESQEVEFFTTSALSFLSSKNIHALKSLIQHFVSQTTLSDGREIVKARLFCNALGSQYFRLTPTFNQEFDAGSVEEKKIINMMYSTQMYYWDNPQLIDDIAKYLLSK